MCIQETKLEDLHKFNCTNFLLMLFKSIEGRSRDYYAFWIKIKLNSMNVGSDQIIQSWKENGH